MARKRKRDIAEYKRRYGNSDDAAPGWDAISARLSEVYKNQEPRHWGPGLNYVFGGSDPIDGISAYECLDGGMSHLHFCTFGYTSLYYDEESAGGECSGYGFEMTFRLATEFPLAEEPIWVINLFQNLARYVFKSGRWFEPNQWIPANGPIRADYPTDIVGLAFLLDPTLGAIESPHGRVGFIQAFGLTSEELERIKCKAQMCEEIIEAHRVTNPLLITDLSRKVPSQLPASLP